MFRSFLQRADREVAPRHVFRWRCVCLTRLSDFRRDLLGRHSDKNYVTSKFNCHLTRVASTLTSRWSCVTFW